MNELIEVSTGTGKKILSPIEKLPRDLHRYSIFNYLPDEGLYRLSQASNAMYAEYKAPLLERAGKKLLTHIVRAEEALALEMISANLTLLLHTSEATDYSNRTYRGYTPFQAALLCHDVTLWKKMGLYFDRLPDGQMEKTRQFKKIFPILTGIRQRTAYDFNVLTQAITNSSAEDIGAALQKKQNDTAICKDLNQFRTDFKALAMQETFFNPSHLIRALKVYNEQFNNWSTAKRDLFWNQVIGYTERFLPACLAQLFVQGFDPIVKDQELLERSLKFKCNRGSFFPLFDSSDLGFDFGVTSNFNGLGVQVKSSTSAYIDIRFLIFQLCKVFQANESELDLLNRSVQVAGESITDNDTLTSRPCCCTIS